MIHDHESINITTSSIHRLDNIDHHYAADKVIASPLLTSMTIQSTNWTKGACIWVKRVSMRLRKLGIKLREGFNNETYLVWEHTNYLHEGIQEVWEEIQYWVSVRESLGLHGSNHRRRRNSKVKGLILTPRDISYPMRGYGIIGIDHTRGLY